jgi:hypothetical protein
MEITRSTHAVVAWQDRLGRLLMAVAALGALTAVLGAIKTVQLASADTVWVQTWRLFGFAMFTGMFALLAWRPRKSAGVWELAFFHKAAMAFSALLLHGAGEAGTAGVIDAVLAGLIACAYFLTRAWTAWKQP